MAESRPQLGLRQKVHRARNAIAWLPLAYPARGSSHPPAPYGEHGCRFPLVRLHRMRTGAGKPVSGL
jgi:hypothetical protein